MPKCSAQHLPAVSRCQSSAGVPAELLDVYKYTSRQCTHTSAGAVSTGCLFAPGALITMCEMHLNSVPSVNQVDLRGSHPACSSFRYSRVSSPQLEITGANSPSCKLSLFLLCFAVYTTAWLIVVPAGHATGVKVRDLLSDTLPCDCVQTQSRMVPICDAL